MGGLIDDGKVRVNVDEALPLESAATAHATGEKGHARGVLVLDLR
ncbi:MAG: zinc-binding dehydrogenase [Streptosporangiales bacterium]